MFTYFHCYHPQTWEAQKECGLIDEHAGVRFMQTATLPEELKFNNLAAKGSSFYNMMLENRLPMYIDRLQGGVVFEDYKFDWRLVDYYREILGDKFIGFQMHEWMNNLASDLRRISECIGDLPWTEENITKSVMSKYPMNYLWLEAQSAKEYALCGNPQTADEFINFAETLFRNRYELCSGQLIPCDSYGLAYQTEINCGVKHFMPEIGAQTPDTRIQIAYARGMARTKNVSFGIYYEPWGGNPFSTCCYHKEDENEWGIKGLGDLAYETKGCNGGSSRSLQKRIQLYGYFAGADFISEEWGMCNTFYDWKDFELTPYGKIKLDFLNIIKKYPEEKIGTPYTPLAVVLPKDLFGIAGLDDGNNQTVFGYPLFGSAAKTMKNVRKALKYLLSNPSDMIGCETANIVNSDIPDCIDVIHEDYINLYEDYEFFVDLTGNPGFSRNHRCISVEEAPEILKNLLPCEVSGGVHWFVNKTADGWLLVMFNNSGIERSVEKGEYILPQGTQKAAVRLKNGQKLNILEGAKDIHFENGTYHIELQPGAWFLAKFK
ncbi:MAG: hypothetical protein IKJ41_04130 [Clostridia bacterium]|nr:hypothetical protein [Clostridia bacterium]